MSGSSNNVDIFLFQSLSFSLTQAPMLACFGCMTMCGIVEKKMGVSLGLDFGAIAYQPRDLTAAWEGCHLSSEGCGVGYVGWCA